MYKVQHEKPNMKFLYNHVEIGLDSYVLGEIELLTSKIVLQPYLSCVRLFDIKRIDVVYTGSRSVVYN